MQVTRKNPFAKSSNGWWAWEYAKIGLRIFPVSPMSKDPALVLTDPKITVIPSANNNKKGYGYAITLSSETNASQIEAWWDHNENYGIGCWTGGSSPRLIALDLDKYKDEYEASELEKLQTVLSQTGGGGLHMLFRLPENIYLSNATDKNLPKGIDVRYNGYIVLPPSIHPSGNPYQWETDPFDNECAMIPDDLLDILMKAQAQFSSIYTILGDPQPVDLDRIDWSEKGRETLYNGRKKSEDRHAHIFGFICECLRKKLNNENILWLMENYPVGHKYKERGIDWLESLITTARESMEEEGLIEKDPSRMTVDERNDHIRKLPYTDKGNAEAVLTLSPNLLRHTTEGGNLYNNGAVWADHSEPIWMSAICDMLQLRKKQWLEENEKSNPKVADNMSTIVGCQRALEALGQVYTDYDAFEPVSHILNVPNGIVDLRSGELIPRPNNHMFLYCTKTPFHPDTNTDIVDVFFEDKIANYKELRDYYQMALGYLLTGENPEQAVHLLHGATRAGKGLTLSALTKALGTYAIVSDYKILDSLSNDGQNFAMNRFPNRRLVVIDEIPGSAKMNAAQLKNLTGGMEIQSAKKGKDAMQFKMTCHIVIASNFPPNPDSGVEDYAFWARWLPLNFPTSHKDDPDLDLIKYVVSDEFQRPFLVWLIEGAKKWYEQNGGLLKNMPEFVRRDVQNLANANDTIHLWKAECLVPDDAAILSRQQVTSSYHQWCEDNGQYPLRGVKFTKRLEHSGLIPDKVGKNSVWKGYALTNKYEGEFNDTAPTIQMVRGSKVEIPPF